MEILLEPAGLLCPSSGLCFQATLLTHVAMRCTEEKPEQVDSTLARSAEQTHSRTNDAARLASLIALYRYH